MTYLLALSILANLATTAIAVRAVLATRDRADRFIQADRDLTVNTIQDLCQRIQAPEQAVIDHQARTSPVVNPPAVGFDNDEDWWEATALTKEQLATEAMAAELATTD